jgi:hypothetical protein
MKISNPCVGILVYFSFFSLLFILVSLCFCWVLYLAYPTCLGKRLRCCCCWHLWRGNKIANKNNNSCYECCKIFRTTSGREGSLLHFSLFCVFLKLMLYRLLNFTCVCALLLWFPPFSSVFSSICMMILKCSMDNGWGQESGTWELAIRNTKTLPSDCMLPTGGPTY